jgi:Ca-activated chloride channel homolog
MTFQWPLALLGLLLLPLAVVAYALLDRRRSEHAARFASLALLPNVVAKAPGRLRHLPAVVLLVALAALLVGVARPHATVSVSREEATVILALDVSRSMTATDVRPSRLVAARLAAERFVKQVPEKFRIGIVAFATRAQVATPPTHDRAAIMAALASLEPGEGTALGEAIALSLRAAGSVPSEDGGERPPASILLLSDGAQTQGEVQPLQAARRARSLGIPIYTIALGTPDGVVERQLPGGFTERTRVPPDPETLRAVASTTHAQFFTAPDDERLREVYDELGSRLGHRDKRAEVTVAFAGGGMVLLLIGGALSSLLFRRLP